MAHDAIITLINVAKFIEPCHIIKTLTGFYPWIHGQRHQILEIL